MAATLVLQGVLLLLFGPNHCAEANTQTISWFLYERVPILGGHPQGSQAWFLILCALLEIVYYLQQGAQKLLYL